MIAICVGHSRPGDTGAVSVGGISEHVFNSNLARLLATELQSRAIACEVVAVYQGSGYGAAMNWLADHLRAIKATAALELHFNSADTPQASGHEWLFWHSSTQGRFLASSLARRMHEAFPELPARGIKSKFSADRGAEFLRRTPCPACIAEPFFGSCAADWQLATTRTTALARALANGLDDWLEC